MLISNDYYRALQQDNCKLITWPIATISAAGIRTADGIEHHVDAIVFATGFDVAKTGTPFPVTGRAGRQLTDDWQRGAYAYRSVAVSGYPNLFLTFGPNSGPGHNSALVYMESQIEYTVAAISHLRTADLHSLDVAPEVEARWNERIQRRLARTTWNSGCRSWYLTDDGFNATMFPSPSRPSMLAARPSSDPTINRRSPRFSRWRRGARHSSAGRTCSTSSRSRR